MYQPFLGLNEVFQKNAGAQMILYCTEAWAIYNGSDRDGYNTELTATFDSSSICSSVKIDSDNWSFLVRSKDILYLIIWPTSMW